MDNIYKTGGPNGIIPKMLQSCLNILLPWIEDMLRSNVALRYVPKSKNRSMKIFAKDLGIG